MANGTYLRNIVKIKINGHGSTRKNTESSQIISVSSVDSMPIWHDFDSSKCHSGPGLNQVAIPLIPGGARPGRQMKTHRAITAIS